MLNTLGQLRDSASAARVIRWRAGIFFPLRQLRMRYCRAVARERGAVEMWHEDRCRTKNLFWLRRTKFGAVYLNRAGWRPFAAIRELGDHDLTNYARGECVAPNGRCA